MCCILDRSEKRKIIADARKRGRKTFVAWKIVVRNNDGTLAPEVANWRYRYQPGVNHALTRSGRRWRGRYNPRRPCGIHVFRSHPSVLWYTPRVIQVICHVDDLVCASCGQAVLRKVRIPKAEYERATKKVVT